MINERQAHKYCRDDISKIENYEEAIRDNTQTWHLHHRLELTLDGEFALTPEQLKMHDMYYNRPYYELIFLTPAEHIRIHHKGENNPQYGKHHSEDTRRKISDAMKGENNPQYGKHHSEDTRRKISDTLKGRTVTDETRRKISDAMKGRTVTDETRRKMSEAMKGENNPQYGKHRSEDTRRKMSEAQKRRWARKRELLSHR